ncbi:cytochrome P450 [Sphingomonas sp. HITSZ_GF]|uniref:cytochrome P450 n=1 Tax=Sphingomonas sp. HITSZ_GF TaxID=3037247 RepID=UPI00240D481D|nr:cytochrome P450 [Sphingomonas sp. HITSZ_GF]MDG2532981.1 cytochrome P450 [Sphingomonas sp. HITSZ_GF]
MLTGDTIQAFAGEPGGAPQPFRPPHPEPLDRVTPWHALTKAVRNPIEAWPRALFEGTSWRPPFPGAPVFLTDPTAVRAVMVDHAEDFPHGHLWRRVMHPAWGDGLVAVDGADWRRQRRAAAPAFRAAEMAALAPRMRTAAEAALTRWRSADQPIDIAAETGRIAFDVILDTVLSGGEDFARADTETRVHAFLNQLELRRLSYLFLPDRAHRGKLNRPAPEGAALRADVDRMIAHRRRTMPRGDLVDLLLGAIDPDTGRPMEDPLLRDNLLGFIMAGHETSAVTLGWALWLAAAHAPSAARMRAETEAVTGGAPIGPEHVERLVFTRQLIQETLRLYPPGYQLTRVCTRDAVIDSRRIRAGTRILIPVYALHRHRQYWRAPDAFDPDRFAPGMPTPDRHLYLPFGAGPRICLGAAFAMTELVVVLATLVRAARFTPLSVPRPVASTSIRPQHGLPMRVDFD